MAVSYDENVIVTFAERLYSRSAAIVIVYTLFGAVIGALVVKGVVAAYRINSDATNGVTIVIALIFAVLGGMIGSARAFTLRLLAQQALCQLQIERNTRGLTAANSAPVVSRPPPPPPLRGTW